MWMIRKFKPPVSSRFAYPASCWQLQIHGCQASHSKLIPDWVANPQANSSTLVFLFSITAIAIFPVAQSKTLVSFLTPLFLSHPTSDPSANPTDSPLKIENPTSSHHFLLSPCTSQYDMGRGLLWGISSCKHGGWEVLWSAVYKPENRGTGWRELPVWGQRHENREPERRLV